MHADAARAIEVLSENGRHFLRSTLDEIRRDNSTGNRNAVIFVAAALEVLLKTRLAIEHWTLVFDDPAKAKLSELKSGEFVSVQASKLIPRLNNVASLDLKAEVPDKVFRLRNRVVHYAPPTGLAVRVEVALGLNFALQLIHDHVLGHLQDRAHAELTALKEEISQVFLDLDEFRTKRLTALEGALQNHGTVVECPDCNQRTLVLKSEAEEDTCLFCLAATNGEELARRYVADALHWSWRDEADGGEDPIHWCLNCDAFSLVSGVQVLNRPKIAYACFSCAEIYEHDDVDRCGRCGDVKTANEDVICPACWAAMEPR
jgi:ssDNA-binding Zn-finger/Zn-ribbon topoisomerase 1